MSLSSSLIFTSLFNLFWPFGIKWILINRIWKEESTNAFVFFILTVIYLYIMGLLSSSSSTIEKCDEISGMNYAIALMMIIPSFVLFFEKSSFVNWLSGIFGSYANNNDYIFPNLLILGFLLMVFSWPIISLIWFESQKISCNNSKKNLNNFSKNIAKED